MKVYGWSSYDGSYSFHHEIGGEPEYYYNEETGQWEYDYNNIMPGMKVLSLILRPFKEPELPKIELKEKTNGVLSQSSLLSPQSLVVLKKDSLLQNKFENILVLELDIIDGKKDFYTINLENYGLYIGIEKLTPETTHFWNRRLGLDVAMRFGKTAKWEFELITTLGHPETQLFKDIVNLGGFNYSGDVITEQDGVLFELYEKYSGKDMSHERSFMDAYRAFKHAIDTNYGNTLVAYVSSKPITGISNLTMSVDTPDIKMAMAVHLIPGLAYNPLGIHRTSISTFYDRENKLNYKNISLDFQKAVSNLVGEIDPTIKLLVVRPLHRMGEILKESGIPFTLSPGAKSSELPYFMIDGIDRDSTLSYQTPFVLVHPSESKEYHIPRNHWFVQSPFYGHHGDPMMLSYFPILTALRKDLM